jgi:DNA polymerase sigma
MRLLVTQRFRNAAHALWPDAVAVCHSSTATGTFLPGGDIDFVVHREGADTAPEALLAQLNDHLTAMQVFKWSEVLAQAKTPIIKAVKKPFGFKIDIAIDNHNGILNVQRNREMMRRYSALFPLLMFLKFFIFQCKLDEPYKGGMSSNTLQNLIVFIIQASGESIEKHLGKLTIAFFKTFGQTFNFITTGISIREGGRLFSRLEHSRVNWKSPICLSVEDPQRPGTFIGENCFECPKFRDRCFHAYRGLMADDRPDGSMLLRIIERPEWIIKRRQELQNQYQGLLGNAVECFSLARPRREDGDRRGRDPPPYARRPPSRQRERRYDVP